MKQSKTKRSKAKSKVQVRDLKSVKDAKGGGAKFSEITITKPVDASSLKLF